MPVNWKGRVATRDLSRRSRGDFQPVDAKSTSCSTSSPWPPSPPPHPPARTSPLQPFPGFPRSDLLACGRPSLVGYYAHTEQAPLNLNTYHNATRFVLEVVGGISIAVCRRPRLPLDSRIGPHPNPLPEGEGEDLVRPGRWVTLSSNYWGFTRQPPLIRGVHVQAGPDDRLSGPTRIPAVHPSYSPMHGPDSGLMVLS